MTGKVPSLSEPGTSTSSARRGQDAAEASPGQHFFPALLEDGETAHSFADAVFQGGRRARTNLGFFWGRYHQVTLVTTDRRLFEIARPFGGRSSGRRIRSWKWENIEAIKVSGRYLVLTVPGRQPLRWRLQNQSEIGRLQNAIGRCSLLMGGRAASADGIHPQFHCPDCGSLVLANPRRCRACNTGFVTPRRAVLLSFLIPGGGHFVTGHWVLGLVRMIFEVLCFVGLWCVVGSFGRDFPVPIVVFLSLAPLVAIKVEAALTAKALAKLVTAETAKCRRTWNWRATICATLFAAWAGSAVLFAGYTNRGVKRDLEFHAGKTLGWEVQYELPVNDLWIENPIHRSTWVHDEGWELEIFAEPLAFFESPKAWVARVERERLEASHSPGEFFDLGAIDGVYFFDSSGDGDEAVIELRFAVFDRQQRDVHTVHCKVLPSQSEQVNSLVRTLLRRSHWTKAGNPCGSKWDADLIR